jgi:hypothetical protein
MAYDSNTFQVFHRLTDLGKEHYRKMLEAEADRILFKHEHPFKYILMKLDELINIGKLI